MRNYTKLLGYFIFITCVTACKDNNKWLPKSAKETFVLIQPLGPVDEGLLQVLKNSISTYYPVTIKFAAPVDIPANAYYKPRHRYKADSLIGFLHKLKPAGIRIITGVTSKDISTRKGAIADYGVMGLGLTPGYASITSIYRMQGDKPSHQLLAQRLLKTVVHELGHNFGLPHCPNKTCIMADAEGKLNQDNETSLCPQCLKRLNPR